MASGAACGAGPGVALLAAGSCWGPGVRKPWEGGGRGGPGLCPNLPCCLSSSTAETMSSQAEVLAGSGMGALRPAGWWGACEDWQAGRAPGSMAIRKYGHHGSMAIMEVWPSGKYGHQGGMAIREVWPSWKYGHQGSMAIREVWPSGMHGHQGSMAIREVWPSRRYGHQGGKRRYGHQGGKRRYGHQGGMAIREVWPSGMHGHQAGPKRR